MTAQGLLGKALLGDVIEVMDQAEAIWRSKSVEVLPKSAQDEIERAYLALCKARQIIEEGQ